MEKIVTEAMFQEMHDSNLGLCITYYERGSLWFSSVLLGIR